MKKKWELITEDNRVVKVEYNSRYFSEDSISHHFDFHGYAVSGSGYRSHFFGRLEDKEIDIKKVKKLAVSLINEWLLPPQQMELIG